MKIIHSDFRKGEAKVHINSKDDLWYLTQIIDTGDLISGKTERKIKIGDNSADRNAKVVRKKVFLQIKAEKIELNDTLRILGTITQGPDDISLGSHHSFDLDTNSDIKIIKEKWLSFQIDKLKESTNETEINILIVAFDREEAYFAQLSKTGITHLTNISGNVSKKNDEQNITDNFNKFLFKTIKTYDDNKKFGKIIMASPAFWKDEFQKEVGEDPLKKKLIYATCSGVDKRVFNEILKRPEVSQALKDDRTTKEVRYIEQLLNEISKDGLYAYGIKDVRKASDLGAIKTLFISTHTIKKFREEEKYYLIEKIIKTSDEMKAKIKIIDSDNDGGKKLDGISGIGAILRYKI